MTKPLNILVLDDEEDIRSIVSGFLQSINHNVYQGCDGEEGTKILKSNDVDLLITDILMPEKEGFSTIIDVKKSYPSIKIIAMSGGGRFSRKDLLSYAPKLGADYCLNKPFEMNELENVIEQVMNA